MTDEKTLKLKRIAAIVSVLLFLGLLGFLTWFVLAHFRQIASAESFRDYVRSFGVWSYGVGFAVQVMQVFVAFIPGEAVEIGMGYAFGAVVGTLLCYAGVAAATFGIFVFVKRFGTKAAALFVTEKQMSSTGFISKTVRDRGRLKTLAFLLFIIPGTPKDLLSYIFPLTPLRCGEYMAISLIARFPSVISSTVGGMLIHNKNNAAAGVLFAVTALVSIAGMICFDRWSKRADVKNKENESNGNRSERMDQLP